MLCLRFEPMAAGCEHWRPCLKTNRLDLSSSSLLLGQMLLMLNNNIDIQWCDLSRSYLFE